MPVRGSRNCRIAGLSTRNGRFYAVLWADRGNGTKGARRLPLVTEDGEPIRTLTAAKDALDMLKNNRRENALPQPGHKPSFDPFAAEYLAMQSTRKKKNSHAEQRNAIARPLARSLGHRAD